MVWAAPGGLQPSKKVGGRTPPTFLDGSRVLRGRPDPPNERFSAKSLNPHRLNPHRAAAERRLKHTPTPKTSHEMQSSRLGISLYTGSRSLVYSANFNITFRVGEISMNWLEFPISLRMDFQVSDGFTIRCFGADVILKFRSEFSVVVYIWASPR